MERIIERNGVMQKKLTIGFVAIILFVSLFSIYLIYNQEKEPLWGQSEIDILYKLAENEVGKHMVEGVAVNDDATEVEFHLLEPKMKNAISVQYSILYGMKDDYDIAVKFVFYKEQGNAQTIYLKTTFNADTLANFDWSTLSKHNLQDFADEYNYFSE